MNPTAQIILSNSIEHSPNGGSPIKLVDPFLVINPKYFPTQYSFAITILTTGLSFTGKEFFSIAIQSPESKEIFNTGDLESPSFEGDENIVMNFEVKNIDFAEEGKYEVEFIFDNNIITQTSFYVLHFANNKK